MLQTETSAWTPPLLELWGRIERHDFRFGQPLDFTTRLARDKKWPFDFVQSAILEYCRFCFLSVIADHAVSPGEEVDEVWHLHLIYSRDYWDEWCANVLRRPLHHEPTRGSAEDQSRLRTLYAQTLALYETFFGPPDAGFWPATYERFGRPGRYRSFDANASFLVPRPTALWRRWGGSTGDRQR